MKKQSRFVAAGIALVAVVGYLMVTGMRDAMMYYHTPDELHARLAADPSIASLGIKVGGRVEAGTVQFDPRTLNLTFRVVDVETGATGFPVRYTGPLPDTFEEGRDVVVEGRMSPDGAIEASTVLTKCGSRYEAMEEDFRA